MLFIQPFIPSIVMLLIPIFACFTAHMPSLKSPMNSVLIFYKINHFFVNREKLKNQILCQKRWCRLGDLSVDSNFAKPLITSFWICRTYQILCLTSDIKYLNHQKFPLVFFCQDSSLCMLWSSLFFYLFFYPLIKT